MYFPFWFFMKQDSFVSFNSKMIGYTYEKSVESSCHSLHVRKAFALPCQSETSNAESPYADVSIYSIPYVSTDIKAYPKTKRAAYNTPQGAFSLLCFVTDSELRSSPNVKNKASKNAFYQYVCPPNHSPSGFSVWV